MKEAVAGLSHCIFYYLLLKDSVNLHFVTMFSQLSECLISANLPGGTVESGKERFGRPRCNPAKQGFLDPLLSSCSV